MALLADDGGDELPAEDLVDARVVGVAPQRLQLLLRLRVHRARVGLFAQLEVFEDRRLLPLDLLGADALGEMAEQFVRVLLVHTAKLRRPLRYLR